MTKKDIIDAYVRIRTIDHTIPDEVLDFMKDAAIEILEEEERLLKFKEQFLSEYEMVMGEWKSKLSKPKT